MAFSGAVTLGKRIHSRVAPLRDYPRFLRTSRAFRDLGGVIDERRPILTEFRETAALVDQHYFRQDMLVAQRVLQANPQKHVDVGSRIDGFVAHIAVVREIEVIDIRESPPLLHPNIRFRSGDITSLPDDLIECTSSLSCLHTLEHFGLGRYGDTPDPQGHVKGLRSLTRMLRAGGMLYLSVPVGHRKTVFNAHRIFDPHDIPDLASEQLELMNFDFIDDEGSIHETSTLALAEDLDYGCGIYTFKKRRAKDTKTYEDPIRSNAI
jgi:hypothetical protein